MTILRRVRFSMATVMMFVVASASGSALFVKVRAVTKGSPDGWQVDVARHPRDRHRPDGDPPSPRPGDTPPRRRRSRPD